MRVFVAAILTIMFSPPMLATAQDTAVGRPVWAMGDEWKYRGPDGSEFTMTVLSAASDGYAVQFQDSKGKNLRHYTIDVAPPRATFFKFQWPLETGKKWEWTRTGEAINQIGGNSNTWATAETVEGRESVTVPAGTFDTVRIHGRECNVTQQQSGLQGSSCGDFDVWYASEVKNYVRVRWTGSYWGSQVSHPQELISYNLH